MLCETPLQSVGAALAGGLCGAGLGLWLGLGGPAVLSLAGLLGGTADLGAHVVRGDDQFRAAVAQIRR